MTKSKKHVNGKANGNGAKAVAKWVLEINQSDEQDDVATILGYTRTGQKLAAAKAELGHGNWVEMFSAGRGDRGGKLRFGVRKAQCLMRIAERPLFSNAQWIAYLPARWAILDDLICLTDEQIIELIKEGLINPDMDRKEVRTLPVLTAHRLTTAIEHFVEECLTAPDLARLQEHVAKEAQWTETMCTTVRKLGGWFKDLANTVQDRDFPRSMVPEALEHMNPKPRKKLENENPAPGA